MTNCTHDPAFTTDGICWKCNRARIDAQRERLWNSAPKPERFQNPAVTLEHLHQCGWCGEYYIGSRVDHGCPPDTRTVDDLSDTYDENAISAMEHSYVASFELSADDIAEMEARCDEQRIDRDTNAGMCN